MKPSAVSNRPANRPSAFMVFIMAVILSALFTKPTDAQPRSQTAADHSTHPASGGTPSAEERQLVLDHDRLEFEKQKFVVETKRGNDQIQNEKTKTHWSVVSTIVPIIAALLTLGYSIWSFRKQSIEAARLQNEGAKLQFFIKAAEIAFAGKTPKAVEHRGRILKKIFGDRLPENFPAPFEAGEPKETPAEKITFLELLLKYPGKEQQILKLWIALFGDPWLERVKPIVTGGASNELNMREVEEAGSTVGASECAKGGIAGVNPEALVRPAASGSVAESGGDSALSS
jgi:hypothetical protein